MMIMMNNSVQYRQLQLNDSCWLCQADCHMYKCYSYCVISHSVKCHIDRKSFNADYLQYRAMLSYIQVKVALR